MGASTTKWRRREAARARDHTGDSRILQRQKISREFQLTTMAGFLAAMWNEAVPEDYLQTKDGRDMAKCRR